MAEDLEDAPVVEVVPEDQVVLVQEDQAEEDIREADARHRLRIDEASMVGDIMGVPDVSDVVR